MKNISRHTGELRIIRRENNSVNGNPRYFCWIDGVHFYTAVDSMHGYELPNYDRKTITVTIGMHYNRATLNRIEAAK